MNSSKTAQHTPGPWMAQPVGRGQSAWQVLGPREVGGAYPILALCKRKTMVACGYEIEGNAMLCAAAPDLLAVLKQVQKRLGITNTFCPLGAALDLAKPLQRAIMKAEGGAA